jgi:hypothetical protein
MYLVMNAVVRKMFWYGSLFFLGAIVGSYLISKGVL